VFGVHTGTALPPSGNQQLILVPNMICNIGLLFRRRPQAPMSPAKRSSVTQFLLRAFRRVYPKSDTCGYEQVSSRAPLRLAWMIDQAAELIPAGKRACQPTT
jgi:hypothetical protein